MDRIVDGNTRLCTATAAQSLKESFGCDGQPASYADVDHADQAAKELARTAWDPVSKQPQFKTAAVRVARED
jgi:hypothetical protein